MSNSDNNRYYRTSNFYLAAFLFAKGIELANIDRTEGHKRATFVFIESPLREELTHDFNYAQENAGDTDVDARKFTYAIKTLKDRLYQD